VVADNKTLLNQVRSHLNYRLGGNPALAIDTNFDVKNGNAISYTNNGLWKSKSANTSWDTGTSATIATTKWGAFLVGLDASGNPVSTWFTAAGAGYASEAAAIAAITDTDATYTYLGYVTVQAAGSTWTAGTDALTTGTGGTPATTTNYYNTANPNNLRMGAAVSSSPPAALSASAPSATAVDTAGDLIAAKIGDMSGTAV
jgi:hypothetical protein